jgi:hypothetical protein
MALRGKPLRWGFESLRPLQFPSIITDDFVKVARFCGEPSGSLWRCAASRSAGGSNHFARAGFPGWWGRIENDRAWF